MSMIEISTEYGPATIDNKVLADGLRRYRKAHEIENINTGHLEAEKELENKITKIKRN